MIGEVRWRGVSCQNSRVPVGDELLRLPGAGAPVIHLLASEEEKHCLSLTQ
jgi:hypothetical protein